MKTSKKRPIWLIKIHLEKVRKDPKQLNPTVHIIWSIWSILYGLYDIISLTVYFLGWIMKVKLSDESELSGLMDEESYTTFCDEQES